MKTLRKVLGLTLLILIIAASVWVLVYYANYNPKAPKPEPQTPSALVKTNGTDPIAVESGDPARLNKFLNQNQETSLLAENHDVFSVDITANQKLTNPFTLTVNNTKYQGIAWSLQEQAGGSVIASGTIAIGDKVVEAWYSGVPKNKNGTLMFVDQNTNTILQKISVALENQTQSVLIYFRPAAMSNCNSVESVKRTIVTTGDDPLNYYEAAMLELLKGPTPQESAQGIVTMIPESASLLQIGRKDNGRYTADMNKAFLDNISIDCFKQIAAEQVRQTLSSVPLPGRTMPGMVLINGEEFK